MAQPSSEYVVGHDHAFRRLGAVGGCGNSPKAQNPGLAVERRGIRPRVYQQRAVSIAVVEVPLLLNLAAVIRMRGDRVALGSWRSCGLSILV